MTTLAHLAVGLAGLTLVVAVWRAAILAFVVPRPTHNTLLYQRWVRMLRLPVETLAHRRDYIRRDWLLAALPAFVIVSLVPFWLTLFSFGYGGMTWAADGHLSALDAWRVASSSLLTLGDSPAATLTGRLVGYAAAVTGPLLVALLIGYLPTLYGAYNRREAEVTLLSGRGGEPAWGPEILARHEWAGLLPELDTLYRSWERLMADIAESHTSYTVLVYLRSPNPRRNWLLAMLAVMDSAALQLARTPSQAPMSARLVLRAGISTLQALADSQSIGYDPDPMPNDPLMLTYDDFLVGWERLDRAGFPAETSPEAAWLDFRGWRVNYETIVHAMARRVDAPPVAWSGVRVNLMDLPLPSRQKNRRHDDLSGETPVRNAAELNRRHARLPAADELPPQEA